MQRYKYTALNLQNQKIKGVFIAKDEKDLGEQLAKQGLYLIESKQYNGVVPSSFFTLSRSKVTFGELTTFCRQFAIMLNTKIPILDCLDILRNQHYSAYFKKVLQVIYEDVKSGIVLSEALNKHPKNFPEFFRSMVYVGEMSGKLDLVFNSLADYYEKDSALKRKVKGAMAYPMMLLGMTVGVVFIMLLMVVPTFKDAMSKLTVEPSGLTKAVYDLSEFFVANWSFIIIGILAFVLLVVLLARTQKGKYVLDVMKLKLPLIRTVQLNIITARFARAFGLLLSSGMDLNEAMVSVEIVIGNRYMKKKFREAAEQIRQGMSLSHAFENHKLFPKMMLQMLAIGERTASLDSVLTKSCEFFDAQVETSMNSLTSKIQPAMMLFMGAVIGTLFIAVYSPMLSIMEGLV